MCFLFSLFSQGDRFCDLWLGLSYQDIVKMMKRKNSTTEENISKKRKSMCNDKQAEKKKKVVLNTKCTGIVCNI